MQIQENFSLKNYNTFGLPVQARYFAEFTNLDELKALLARFAPHPKLILGGGSNILFTKDFPGLVLRNRILGIEKLKEDPEYVWLKVGAGENWHAFVEYCLAHNYAGVENLSLIPGTVGAAPMQNIGAYGIEIKEVIDEVEALQMTSQELHRFTKEDCRFGYRESIFKNTHKHQYIITHVKMCLFKQPRFNIHYGAIEKKLQERGAQTLSIQLISEVVCEIRRSKLPDPAKIGNAGSFFKNPEIPLEQFQELQSKFPDIVSYPVSKHIMKVPAAWLIDRAGWKGQRFGDIGVHKNQALVLVNYGQGNGQAIYELSQRIQASIEEVYGIRLTPEINII